MQLDIHHDHGSSHDSSSYNDTSTESDIDEKNSIGNHSGDHASNNLLMDTNTVPLMQKVTHMIINQSRSSMQCYRCIKLFVYIAIATCMHAHGGEANHDPGSFSSSCRAY